MKLAGYYAGTGKTDDGKEINEGYDLQGAYAISDKWALTAGFFKRKERDTYIRYNNLFDSSVVNYQRKLFEIGGGYFVPLDARKQFYFSIYGGMGFGKFSFDDRGIDANGFAYTRSHESKITKGYLQPGFSVAPVEYIRIFLTGRVSFVQYGSIRSSYQPNEEAYFNLDQLKGLQIFAEPSFNMQVGIPAMQWVKLDAGLTFATHPRDNLKARSFCPFIGLSFDFSKVNKK